MYIPSYIFQSPYPQQVQFGRPDPVAQAQQKAEETTQQAAAIQTAPQQERALYDLGSVTQEKSSVNVAASSADAGVSASLAAFTTLNSQVQAAATYSAQPQ
jgi:hypothetical protein